MTARRVLVTGATGFVGNVLCESLVAGGYFVRAAVRRAHPPFALRASEIVVVGDISSATPWESALSGVDAVVHLAGLAHVFGPDARELDLYDSVNSKGTEALVRAASKAGVPRFIYMSSVKVNGESTSHVPFRATDAAAPADPYGVSKHRAEQAVLSVANAAGTEAVCIRPPLVYGPGVKANFLRLLSYAHRGIPLPFASIGNARSLVSVWNLASLVMRTLEVSSLPSGILMVSDGVDLSTPDLIRALCLAMERPARIFGVPTSVLRMLARLAGKQAEFTRLCGSLQVDISETRRLLKWTPPVTVEEGFRRTARWYVNEVAASDR